jgi:DNA-binding HxlR family transcriptional regulator
MPEQVTDDREQQQWDRDAWNLDPDSIALALSALSPRASGMVMREAFYGTRRFDDFLRRLQLSPGVLSTRLRELVADDLLMKVPYRAEGARERDEYRLTDKGRALVPALVALRAWADEWLMGPDGPTVVLRHRDCGAEVHTTMSCAAGHDVSCGREITVTPGPGARPAHPN